MNGMNKVLRDFIPNKNMAFFNGIFINEYNKEDKGKTLDEKECGKFIADHIEIGIEFCEA